MHCLKGQEGEGSGKETVGQTGAGGTVSGVGKWHMKREKKIMKFERHIMRIIISVKDVERQKEPNSKRNRHLLN